MRRPRVRLDPGERGRGLSFSLSPTFGTPSGSADRLWGARDARDMTPGGEVRGGPGPERRGGLRDSGGGWTIHGHAECGLWHVGRRCERLARGLAAGAGPHGRAPHRSQPGCDPKRARGWGREARRPAEGRDPLVRNGGRPGRRGGTVRRPTASRARRGPPRVVRARMAK